MSSKPKSESGQVVVLAAGATLLIIGMAALAVDVGSLYATRRNMQTAADAAAVAGANALETTCGTTSGCTCESETVCTSAAQDVATFNGYTSGITVKTPATKPNPATGVYVEVDVAQSVPTYFLRALGYNTVSVKTTAVAGYAPTPNCVYISDNTDSNTLVASGGSSISANCGILDESTDSKGMVDSGGSTIAGSSIGIVATSYGGGGTPTCGGSTASCPTTGVAPSPDPLAYLQSAKPMPGTCASGTDLTNATSGTGGTIHPGTYCTGIKVTTGGDTITLSPGLYILTGNKGLSVSGGTTITGSGVTIYNSGTGKIAISGGSTMNLTAPTDSSAGGIPSVLFFQDPSNTSAAAISGGSSGNIQGALYFPTAQLTFSGGSSTNPQDVVLDAWKMTISGGSSYLSAPGAALGGGPPITTARLYQ